MTLEVTTTEAQKLALAQTVGQLSLALRQAGAADATTTRRISIADLGESEGAQPPIVIPSATAPSLAPLGTVIGVTRPIKDKEDNFKRVEYRVRREGSRP